MTYDSVDAVTGIFDTPEACVDRLHRVREEFGPGRVICWFNFSGLVPHDRVLRSMELFSAEVLPHVGADAAGPGRPVALRIAPRIMAGMDGSSGTTTAAR